MVGLVLFSVQGRSSPTTGLLGWELIWFYWLLEVILNTFIGTNLFISVSWILKEYVTKSTRYVKFDVWLLR